jgi:hypothetical protein
LHGWKGGEQQRSKKEKREGLDGGSSEGRGFFLFVFVFFSGGGELEAH